eukprot:6482468-Pyramimonas_sp.AAC.1
MSHRSRYTTNYTWQTMRTTTLCGSIACARIAPRGTANQTVRGLHTHTHAYVAMYQLLRRDHVWHMLHVPASIARSTRAQKPPT